MKRKPQLPRQMYVWVRLKGEWKTEWRTVTASSMKDAEKKAARMPDVKQVYEISLVPGGVVT